ncbi:MAG: DNA mismatch repair protein MutS [Fibrobacterota bacterium]
MPSKTTPMMKQFFDIKARYPGCILFFRMGDFYEMFGDDAVTASSILGLTLTARNHGGKDKTPLCGFPHHAVDRYIPLLLKAGHKIGICEQTEDPAKAKGLVKRDIIEIITAGTATDRQYLDDKSNNYLCAVIIEDKMAAVAAADISTGEFIVTEIPEKNLIDELSRINPAEIIAPEETCNSPATNEINDRLNLKVMPFDTFHFSGNNPYNELTSHFGTANLEGFGLLGTELSVRAAGAAIAYLKYNKMNDLSHINSLRKHDTSDYMALDSYTLRNLELIEPIFRQDKDSTLLAVIDNTVTAMGGRLLKKFICHPLKNTGQINRRLSCVTSLHKETVIRENIRNALKSAGDIERIAARTGYDRVNCRDLLNLKESLALFPQISVECRKLDNQDLSSGSNILTEFSELHILLDKSIADSPPLSVKEGGLLKQGYSEEADEIRKYSKEGKSWINSLQQDEKKRTGIPSLKVKYNKVFGYYIEIPNTHKSSVPESYIRKQTLVNAERFITPELKEWEDKVLGAEEKLKKLEYSIFCEIRETVKKWLERLFRASAFLSELDVYACFAENAFLNGYCRPKINDSDSISINEGRHPVVEKLHPSEEFIPNDLLISNSDSQIHLITGPNMAGKSTFIRQAGLIVLMAQIGSFVPAKKAEIGVVDRIFTRVGAADRLSRGQSTFLVEMSELANILNNAGRRSLVLLDEIGRGTSTFDGLSIAWSLVEYLHNNPDVAAKTLFATHYHELTELELTLPRVKNFNIAVREWNDRIMFLRKIVAGACDHSYGIQVARLAGVPDSVVKRAKEILSNLEEDALTPDQKPAIGRHNESPSSAADSGQMDIFWEQKSKILKKLNEIDVGNLTPIEAINKLYDLKKYTAGDG